MYKVDKRIIDFINDHHVLTISTSVNNQPYCANCFYVYSEKENIFVFTSDMETRHAGEFNINNKVSASIVLETSIIGKIQGLQLTGKVFKLENELLSSCKIRYLKKFPVAVLMKTHLWGVRPDFLKMTHNQLGFGKKLIWSINEGLKMEEKDV